MVTGRVLIRVVHGALEHGAVHGPCATLVATSNDDYPTPTFESIVVAHARTVGNGNTGGKGLVSRVAALAEVRAGGFRETKLCWSVRQSGVEVGTMVLCGRYLAHSL